MGPRYDLWRNVGRSGKKWEAARTPGASAIAGSPAGRTASGPVAAAVEAARSVQVEEAVVVDQSVGVEAVVVARPVAVAGAGGVAEAEADGAEAGGESDEGELDHAKAAS